MPTILEPAKQEEIKELRHVMMLHHPCLIHVELVVGLIFAESIPDKKGNTQPAIIVNSYQAYGTAQITPVKWRAAGAPDALVTIDRMAWNSLDENGRWALLDHELTHLQVKADDKDLDVLIARRNPDDNRWDIEGIADSDCLGRPKLAMRKHDWHLGGFADVTRRWGTEALEFRVVKLCEQKNGQLIWDWAVSEHEKDKTNSEAAT